MIQIDTVELREVRGIRELDVDLERKNFVISGPNGSGKSGVVDGIQFALAGEISRLAGKGTVGLTVQRHGPHVDRRDDPEAATVSLKFFMPETGRTAVLTRNMKKPKSFSLVPDDADVRALLKEVAEHPELTLSRREIIKYILVEAGERSKEIQALLKLDEIGKLRSTLNTAKNRLANAEMTAKQAVSNANDALRRHLDAESLSKEEVLASVNKHRKVLDLPVIGELTTDTSLNSGVSEGVSQKAFNKESALRDLRALQEAHGKFGRLCKEETAAIVVDLQEIQNDPALLEIIQRHSFVEQGLAFVEGANCPLCDWEWENEEHLIEHLKTKLAKSEEVERVKKRLLDNARVIANEARRIAGLVRATQSISKVDGPDGVPTELESWYEHLTNLADALGTVEGALGQKACLEEGWVAAPDALTDNLDAAIGAVKAKPDQTASVSAQTFLTLAQDRLAARRRAQRVEKAAAAAATASATAYRTYCDVADEQLRLLYEEVEDDFSTYYRELNANDEDGFKAKFESAEGKLDLAVDFYDRGMFPPGAYHSEGHQDGMGVCLYLALMKSLLGNRFRFALLDDVVMSVDADHRKQFCKLLKNHFPNTQFIITTHDKIWAKQMQTEHLVEYKASVAFHGWSVETGPISEQSAEIWDEIDADLAKNDVPAGAHRLRRHLEYVSAELADQLGAQPTYRGDFSYDLGDLLQPVIKRHGELIRLAAKAADVWKDASAKAKVEALKTARAEALEAYGDENWVLNTAVHYNEWANFSKSEFQAVVGAFKSLLLQFRCSKPECASWLYVTPRKGNPEILRCHCMSFHLNLKS